MEGYCSFMKRQEFIVVTTGISIIDNIKRMGLESNHHEILTILRNAPSSQCAELETLDEYLKKERDIASAEIHLIYVNNTEGRKAVDILKNILNQWMQDKKTPFSKVQSIDAHPFEFDVHTNSIRPDSLLSLLFHLRQKAREENKSFCIIASGGYKAIFYYTTLFGTLFKERVVYKYLDSKKLIYMLELPIYWDVRELEAKTAVFRIGGSGDSNHYSNFVLKFLSENYDTIREDLLYHEPTLRYITNDKLRHTLKNNIPVWSNLWLGDQVPEMVEHSKRHSRRILEKFEYMMNDIEDSYFIDKPTFMFLLIASAYLHDIGHTVMEYNDFPFHMFPEHLRVFHNILTKKFINIHYKHILKLDNLEKDLLKALSLICMYHRKNMYITGELNRVDKYFLETVLDEPAVCLINHPEFQELPDELQKITLKVTAILKILDEMDVQADRVVDDHYAKVRRWRTDHEIEYLMKLLEKEDKNLWNKLKNSLSNNFEDLRKEARKIVDNNLDRIRKSTDDIRAISLYMRIIFKKMQEKHFEQHKKVKAVFPELQKASKNLKIIILADSPESWYTTMKEINEQLELLKKDALNLAHIDLLPFCTWNFPEIK